MKSEDEVVAYREGEVVQAGSEGGETPSVGTFGQLGILVAIAMASGGLYSAIGYFSGGIALHKLHRAFIALSLLYTLLALLARRIRFDTLRTFLASLSVVLCILIPRLRYGIITDSLLSISFVTVFLTLSEGVVAAVLRDRDDISLLGAITRLVLSMVPPLVFIKEMAGLRSVFELKMLAIVFFLAHMSVAIRLHYLAEGEKPLKIEEKGKAS